MDIAVLDAIQQHLRTPLLDQIMLLATHLGDLALVWLVPAPCSSRSRGTAGGA